MDLCKIGVHDYECVSDLRLVEQALEAHLKSKGFAEIEREYFNVWKMVKLPFLRLVVSQIVEVCDITHLLIQEQKFV